MNEMKVESKKKQVELPIGWKLTSLKKTCEMYQPKTISKKEMVNGGKFPVFGANGIIGTYHLYNHETPQVLVTCRGATCGTVNLSKPYSWINGNAMVVNPLNGCIDQSFLVYLLKGGIKLEKAITGTAQPQITRNSLEPLELPLPPLDEQKRIVAKIEELFSELDAGEQSLRDARKQLTLYRQSLLKQAFEGKLTETWRQQNPDKLQDPKTLLARIQQERNSRHQQQLQTWQQDVEQWEQNGKVDKKPTKPRPYLDVTPLSSEELALLADLPEIWQWTKIGHLFGVFVGATPKRTDSTYWNGSIPWVSSGEVTFCRINKTKEHITEEGLKNTSTSIHPIGTIILAMIGEGKTRGQAAILNIEASHNQNTAAIRVSEVTYSPEFLYNFLLYRYAETRKSGSGNNQKALNKQRVADLPTPICSLPEQQEIVRLLDEQFTAIEQNEKEIDHALTQSQALRQSILKKAFSGKLN